MPAHELMFQLKSTGLWNELDSCFHVVSYLEAERIGNIHVSHPCFARSAYVSCVFAVIGD